MNDRKEWLKKRNKGIGGSDAGIIMNLNPWKTQHQLWLEKTGRAEAEDISNKPAVKYGTNAEEHLRELFKLDYPELEVEYSGNKIYYHKDYEYLIVTPDGHLINKDGVKGLLEIKTTTVRNKKGFEDWDNRIPDVYYCQCLHGMNVLDYEFTYLRVQIKNIWNSEIVIRDYYFERNEEELKVLEKAEIDWWNIHIVEDREPVIKLPKI